jgi:DNA ligase-associated metallophosphoesterase
MPLLSQPPRKTGSAPRGAPPKLPIVMTNGAAQARVGEAQVTALPEGALWIASAKTLVVSDLHLEKGSSYALRGQLLPPYDTHAALAKLAALIERLAPDIVVSLGDAFHDGGGPARMAARDRKRLEDMVTRCDWIWIEGNHDGRSAETLGGAVRAELRIGALVLRHEPSPGEAPGEIAGHLHPCARVVGRGGAVRRRCFAIDGARLVMPAFGAFTGGLNIRDDAFSSIFPDGATALVLGRDRVLPAPPERLAPG